MRFIRKAGLLGALAVVGWTLSGCGTVVNLVIGVDAGASTTPNWVALHAETRIFGGLQVDANAVHKASKGEEGWIASLIGFLFVFDFPLSFVADIITLPITIPIELSREPMK